MGYTLWGKAMSNREKIPGQLFGTTINLEDKDNLEKAGTETKFFSRLQLTYEECNRLIRDAVMADEWIDVGIIAETEDTKKRPATFYKAFDATVTLYDTTYRAIVMHSSVHDKRRHKRIDRRLNPLGVALFSRNGIVMQTHNIPNLNQYLAFFLY